MPILVTGHRGSAGVPVAGHLERLGHEVIGFDRADGPDLLDLAAVRRAAAGCGAIVHLGALAHDTAGSPEQIMAVNVLGTWHVLLAAEAAGATRVIHFSSAQALGIAEGERPPPRLTTQRGDGANPRGTAKTTTASTSVKLPTTRRSRRCSMPSVRTCEFRRLDLP